MSDSFKMSSWEAEAVIGNYEKLLYDIKHWLKHQPHELVMPVRMLFQITQAADKHQRREEQTAGASDGHD